VASRRFGLSEFLVALLASAVILSGGLALLVAAAKARTRTQARQVLSAEAGYAASVLSAGFTLENLAALNRQQSITRPASTRERQAMSCADEGARVTFRLNAEGLWRTYDCEGVQRGPERVANHIESITPQGGALKVHAVRGQDRASASVTPRMP